MGKFKDKSGKTRVGEFLAKAKEVGVKIAPEVLDIAGDLTGVDALSRLGDAIKGDKEMSPEMKAQALSLLEFDKSEMGEVTKRHAADMVSDSWLSKNVRPIILLFSWFLMALILILDASLNAFAVPEFYLNLLVPLFLTVTAFYFGGRELQKFQITKSKQ